jgi:hypothetical protein
MGEPGLPHAPLEVLAERLLGTVRERVCLALEHQPRDAEQLVEPVVGEVDVVRDAGRHPRVEPEELVHPVAVAGEDHDESLALVLHHLKQDLDRLDAVVTLVLRTVEVVGLIDEEDAASGALQHVPRLRGGVPDVLPDEVVAGDGDDGAPLDVAETMEQVRHPQRDRRLAGAGVAREAHVQGGSRSDKPRLAAQLLDDEQGGDLPDPRLDRAKTDELTVELLEQRLDVGAERSSVAVRRRRIAAGCDRAHAAEPPF